MFSQFITIITNIADNNHDKGDKVYVKDDNSNDKETKLVKQDMKHNLSQTIQYSSFPSPSFEV